MRQSSSDPLPYVQVDRAVKPRAAMLADAIGVSRQHAMGSLIEWWDLCGDPRELERIVEATPPGEEPAVILTPEDAALRFRLASTREVEPVTLARIGLLEELDGGKRFRVRGMSRYFEPVIKRAQARRAAVDGGRASAEARRRAHGSAQPAGGRGSVAGSEVASEVAQATTEAEPKRNRSDDRSGTEAEPKPSGQRSAVSGQRSPQAAAAGPATIDDFWRAAQDERTRVTGLASEAEPHPRALSSWASEAMTEVDGDLGRLWAGYRAFLEDPFWRLDAKTKCAWRGWVGQWRQFVPPRAGASPPPQRVAKSSSAKAPVAAESVDWSNVTPGEVQL